jgi:hypothetical protein
LIVLQKKYSGYQNRYYAAALDFDKVVSKKKYYYHQNATKCKNHYLNNEVGFLIAIEAHFEKVITECQKFWALCRGAESRSQLLTSEIIFPAL